MSERVSHLLLNPGPVTLTPGVRGALTEPDLCHREDDFVALFRDVRTRLRRVYPESTAAYAPVILTGSGTAAVEAMVTSLVPAGGAALVAVNGVYGERIAAMLAACGRRAVPVASSWLAGIDLAAVERALAADAAISHVLAVHHETTTGRLNDIASLGALCRRRGVKLLLDAVSSFGGEEIRFAEWNLEACAATANKCLHGAPGVSFVLAEEAVFAQRRTGAASLYLDLFRYYAARDGAPPFTPAVHVFHALRQALREFEDAGGWQARHRRYRDLSRRVRTGLAGLGIGTLLEEPEAYSSVLVSYRLPPGLAYATLHDSLKERGFVIYAGQGDFDGRIFRISTMGAIGDEDIDRLLAAVAAVLSAAANLPTAAS